MDINLLTFLEKYLQEDLFVEKLEYIKIIWDKGEQIIYYRTPNLKKNHLLKTNYNES